MAQHVHIGGRRRQQRPKKRENRIQSYDKKKQKIYNKTHFFPLLITLLKSLRATGSVTAVRERDGRAAVDKREIDQSSQQTSLSQQQHARSRLCDANQQTELRDTKIREEPTTKAASKKNLALPDKENVERGARLVAASAQRLFEARERAQEIQMSSPRQSMHLTSPENDRQNKKHFFVCLYIFGGSVWVERAGEQHVQTRERDGPPRVGTRAAVGH